MRAQHPGKLTPIERSGYIHHIRLLEFWHSRVFRLSELLQGARPTPRSAPGSNRYLEPRDYQGIRPFSLSAQTWHMLLKP